MTFGKHFCGGDIVRVEGTDQSELGLVDSVDKYNFDTKLTMLA